MVSVRRYNLSVFVFMIFLKFKSLTLYCPVHPPQDKVHIHLRHKDTACTRDTRNLCSQKERSAETQRHQGPRELREHPAPQLALGRQLQHWQIARQRD
jgi:hypothetical protein